MHLSLCKSVCSNPRSHLYVLTLRFNPSLSRSLFITQYIFIIVCTFVIQDVGCSLRTIYTLDVCIILQKYTNGKLEGNWRPRYMKYYMWSQTHDTWPMTGFLPFCLYLSALVIWSFYPHTPIDSVSPISRISLTYDQPYWCSPIIMDPPYANSNPWQTPTFFSTNYAIFYIVWLRM